MKVAYVFTDLPDLPGTFASAELEEMADRKLPIEIFVLRNRSSRTAGARRIEERFTVHRSPYIFSRSVLRSMFHAALQHPWLLLRTVAQMIRDAAGSPAILARSLAILPKSVHFAFTVRKCGVTLIHAYWASMPALGATVISRFSGIPFITWAHAGADIYNRRHQTPAALRSRLREARLVLTCNSVNLQHFEKLEGRRVMEKVVLLSHGVDVGKFGAREGRAADSTLRILAVSRLSAAKGIDVLLAACRSLHDRGLSVECRIAGSGKLEASLRGLSDNLGLDGKVQFLGHVDHAEMPALYGWADIFAVPSVIGPRGSRDGLPNVLLEAMACGLACVGSDVASIPEVLKDGWTGLLVPPGQPEVLAAAMERLLHDPELRHRLGRAAATFVRAEYARGPSMDRLYQIFLDMHEGIVHESPVDVSPSRVPDARLTIAGKGDLGPPASPAHQRPTHT